MFDVGDLPVPTFGNCVLKTGVIKCIRVRSLVQKLTKRSFAIVTSETVRTFFTSFNVFL